MHNQGNAPSLSDGEWKLNLPSQGQKFLQQLEDQGEKLKKERDQKQFQIDSLEQVQVSYIWTDHPIVFFFLIVSFLSFLMVKKLREINQWKKIVGTRNTEEKSRRGKKFSFFLEKRNSAALWLMWGVGKNSAKNSSGNPNKGQPDILSGWTTGSHQGSARNPDSKSLYIYIFNNCFWPRGSEVL